MDQEEIDFDYVVEHWFNWIMVKFSHNEEVAKDLFCRGLDILYLTDDRKYYIENGWTFLLRAIENNQSA